MPHGHYMLLRRRRNVNSRVYTCVNKLLLLTAVHVSTPRLLAYPTAQSPSCAAMSASVRPLSQPTRQSEPCTATHVPPDVDSVEHYVRKQVHWEETKGITHKMSEDVRFARRIVGILLTVVG